MIQTLSISIAFALASASPLLAASEQNTGNALLSINPNFLHGYALGVADATPTICAPEGATSGQMSAMVRQYLERHPEQRHISSHLVVREVLRNAWPCTAEQSASNQRRAQ